MGRSLRRDFVRPFRARKYQQRMRELVTRRTQGFALGFGL